MTAAIHVILGLAWASLIFSGGIVVGATLEKRYQLKREAERKRKSRAKLKAQKLDGSAHNSALLAEMFDARFIPSGKAESFKAFVPCGGRELFTK